MRTETTPVLIVGAGPTGMALSIALHQRGVRHLLIDRLQQGQNTSRAGVIHAHTLQALSELGVAPGLVERGLRLSRFAIRDRDRALLSLRFDALPTEFAYLLMLPQNQTESVLADRIEQLGGEIRRGVVAQSIEQVRGGARVTVQQGEQRYVIAADWVVGADGMHSLVREATGTAFEGASYAESFVLADVRLDRAPAPGEVSLFFSPEGLLVVAPLPDGSYRVVATLDDAPEHPSKADVQALLDARGPSGSPSRVQSVAWSTRFRLHHRLARSYRTGRLLLMGDAAHVHSPAGGQGMNTGIVDAVVLGRLLADIVLGVRPARAIELYQQLRRPAAAQVLQMAGRLTAMATVHHPLRQRLRDALLWLVDHVPLAKRRIALALSGLSRARLARLPAPPASAAPAQGSRLRASGELPVPSERAPRPTS